MNIETTDILTPGEAWERIAGADCSVTEFLMVDGAIPDWTPLDAARNYLTELRREGFGPDEPFEVDDAEAERLARLLARFVEWNPPRREEEEP